MTIIRTARPDELPALTQYGDEERDAATSAYLTNLLESGCTRPEWCLVADDAGRLVGNVVLWTIPGRDVPMDFVLLEMPDLETGKLLLAAAGEAARGLGAEDQGHVLDSPAQAPQFQRDPQLREELLTECGFQVARDGYRYIWRAGDPMPTQDTRLTWRALPELGRESFVDFIEDMFADTKDSIFLAEIAEHGVRKAAELNFDEMLEMQHEPHWFEIGYDAANQAVALSLPARNAASAVIGMVGVSQAGRGNGYGASVVARGTLLLTQAGAEEIRGDCDAGNFGMVKGFERSGFHRFANRKMFSRSV